MLRMDNGKKWEQILNEHAEITWDLNRLMKEVF